MSTSSFRNARAATLAIASGLLSAAPSFAQPCHVPLSTTPITGVTGGVVAIESPRGDPSRLYLMGQSGNIRLVRNGSVVTGNVITIAGLGSSGAGYGMAIDPEFSSNGYIYFFIPTGGTSSIVRYTRGTATDPEAFDPASRLNILTIPGAPTQHTGGWLGFGPGGLLYCALGEGSDFSQHPRRLEGKVLRIDITRDDFPVDTNKNYALPPNNPFPAGPWLPEVFLIGLRNPWRCSFDRLTGTLFVGDVGGSTAEEIDIIPPGSPGGMNFGWPCYEGLVRRGTCPGLVHTPPAVDFPRTGGPITISCITGGYVYRGSAIPALRGRYVFGTCAGAGGLLSIDPAHPDTSIRRHSDGPFSVYCLGEDAAGELYLGTSNSAYKVVAGTPPTIDCNANSVRDFCEILAFEQTDFNADNIPDSCQRACLADFNASGTVNAQDVHDYLSVWFPRRPSADLSADGVVGAQDVFDFLAAWFAGC